MHSEQSRGELLLWKKIAHKISATHFSSTVSLTGNNSTQVYVKKYEALTNNSEGKLTVFLLHDIGQYHGRFEQMIKWIQERNSSVIFIAMDFAGHGLSSGTRGHFENIDQLVNDFLFLLRTYKKDHSNNEKMMVLGHGLGGLVALDSIKRLQSEYKNQVDGLILSNFILKFSSFLLSLDSSSIGGVTLKKLLAHSRPIRLLKGEHILSSPEAILSYEQDPLVINSPTLNSLQEIHNGLINIYQHSYFQEKPIMLLNSGMGSFAQTDSIGYFAKGIKKELLTEKKYSLLKHDLYNEIEREIVFEDILSWMKII